MKIVYKVILVNVCTLIGCGIVAVTLPPDTPAVPFGIICLFTLIVMNGAVIVWPRYRKRHSTEKPGSRSTTVKIIIVWIIFVLGLMWNWMQWHHR